VGEQAYGILARSAAVADLAEVQVKWPCDFCITPKRNTNLHKK
jgi:hypothetical protein